MVKKIKSRIIKNYRTFIFHEFLRLYNAQIIEGNCKTQTKFLEDMKEMYQLIELHEGDTLILKIVNGRAKNQ